MFVLLPEPQKPPIPSPEGRPLPSLSPPPATLPAPHTIQPHLDDIPLAFLPSKEDNKKTPFCPPSPWPALGPSPLALGCSAQALGWYAHKRRLGLGRSAVQNEGFQKRSWLLRSELLDTSRGCAATVGSVGPGGEGLLTTAGQALVTS